MVGPGSGWTRKWLDQEVVGPGTVGPGTGWTRNWSPNAANLLVLVVRGRRSLKKGSVITCLIGMKLDIIILSNIPRRLMVFDFSFSTFEAKYKQFLTVFVANNVFISLIFSEYMSKRKR